MTAVTDRINARMTGLPTIPYRPMPETPAPERGPAAVETWARVVFGRGTAGHEWATDAIAAHQAGEPLPVFPARTRATRDARVATFRRLMGE